VDFSLRCAGEWGCIELYSVSGSMARETKSHLEWTFYHDIVYVVSHFVHGM
jgi:hypothetical protein